MTVVVDIHQLGQLRIPWDEDDRFFPTKKGMFIPAKYLVSLSQETCFFFFFFSHAYVLNFEYNT